jgi:pantoate--beta-alanine ligase
MKVVQTVAELRSVIAEYRGKGSTIGFAPTMGFLHEGHLSLFDRAREECDTMVASIFVNPTQFGEGEDLDTYPRDVEGDLAKLEARGVDVAFLPSPGEMYPQGTPLVTINPGPMAEGLCGRHRPGHFPGVLTVVAKLFHMVQPDVAVFGRKDLQQGVLIRRMTEDLDLPIQVVLAPIVREDDGLAMSSRNANLDREARAQAVGISETLRAASEAFARGVTDVSALKQVVAEHLAGYPGLELQYAECVDPHTLAEVTGADGETVLAVAAFCAGVRLIDNRCLGDVNA